MAMTYDSTAETLSGILKKVYGNYSSVIPDISVFLDDFKFEQRAGEEYKDFVNLTTSQGVTYATRGSGAYAFRQPIAGSVQQTTLNWGSILVQDFISWDIIENTLKASSEGAIKQSLSVVMDNIGLTLRKRQEINTLYGGSEIGIVGSVSSNDVVITAASFAPWIWAGSEKMIIEFRTTAGALRGSASITKIKTSDRTITVDSLPSGVTAGDYIYIDGTYGVETIGLKKILSTSGSVFGIDNTTYSGWAANQLSVGGVLSKDAIDNAVASVIDRGYIPKKLKLYTSNQVWNDLEKELYARDRNTNLGSDNRTVGSNNIIIKSQGTLVEVSPSGYVKTGDSFLVDPKKFKRIGPTDFRIGGPKGEQEIQRLPQNAGYSIIAYSSQALYTDCPATNVYLSGITS